MTIDLDALEKLASRIKSAGDDRRYPRFSDMEAASDGLIALIAELKEARAILEPFALLAVDEENGIKGINMNDPISKWLTIAQLVDARAFLARNGKGEG